MRGLPHLVTEVRFRPAVGVIDVEIGVVVDIEKAGAPTPGSVRDPESRGVIDQAAAIVRVQAIAPGFEVEALVAGPEDAGHEPVEIAVVVDVAERRPHSVLSCAENRIVEAPERAVTVVDGELGRPEIGRDGDVRPGIVVDAREGRCKREIRVLRPDVEVQGAGTPAQAGNPGFFADVDEPDTRFVRFVSPQVVGFQQLDGAIHVRAIHPVARRPVRQEHVEVAVQIVVAESRGDRMRGQHVFDVRRVRCDVSEETPALIFIDLARVVVDTAEKQIEIPVAVHVRESGPAVAIVVPAVRTSIGDAGLLGDVLEQQAVALLCELIQIQPIGPTAAVRSAGIAIRNEQVYVAVVVAIARRRASERRFRDRPRFPDQVGSGIAHLEGDVRGLRHVDKGWRSGGRVGLRRRGTGKEHKRQHRRLPGS